MSLDFTQPSVRRAWTWQLLGPINETKWNHLARELFRWQFSRVSAFRRLCIAHDVTPDNLKSWRDIPAVPQQLFKRDNLFAYPHKKAAIVYETSGTTTGQPGRQHLLSTDIYQAVSVESARKQCLFDIVQFLHFLTPSPKENPHSSLSAMFGFWQKAHGPGKFWMRDNRIDFSELRESLAAQIKAGKPVGIAGTAFSFVHLIDAWADLPPLRLPKGSWLLETGGFKGRSREVSKTELYGNLSRIFTVPEQSIWNEYGMSELSSQGYLRGVKGCHSIPAWTRVLVCNPATGREVPIGQRGLIRWIDLANVDSIMALQTLDLAERASGGFRLIGRLPRTEPRGCSLSAEDLATSPARVTTATP